MIYSQASRPAGRSARHLRTLAGAGLALAALGLAGCRHHDLGQPQVAGWALVDPSQRHPIAVSQQPQTIHVRVPAAARGLNPRQRSDVFEFVNRARASDAGNSRVVIQVPAGGDNEIASMYAVSEIRHMLADNGFAESSIVVEAYHAAHGTAPVRLSYLTYVAQPPTCGYWPTNLADQRDNANYPNFGCANQRNLAVMVTNPADLIGPRTESDRPSERRDVVFDKYTKGEHTGAKRPDDERERVEVKNESKSD